MSWTDITDNGRVYSMAHLQPFTHVFRVDESDITIHFTFGFHCFTDEKGDGGLIFNRGERRNFSPSRWEASKDLRGWICERMLDAQVTLHLSSNQRRYFCLDIYDYALFFQITKPGNTTNELKVVIISAYPLDQWGRSMMPKGKNHNLSWVLGQRVKGIVL
ncbi:hypothetical protein ACOQNQ_10565 [Pseudomonas juntendi]|uniref:hypothetical protein n=1 Tax=Pseudomonas TaxID=286 RepID=UPI00026F9350|nr:MULTISPECIES: hypothetical protein [Pseudomonas]EJN39335.1 hypothetical protein PMI38_01143 [Pseudomonas sp. GM84]MCK2109514.1 hypothetical protein [Pseudomonas juntendi]MCK2115261.1 hypothetical protein [Pseudomonas juntendi]